MKLKSKRIINVTPTPVYDLETRSDNHNFCLSNGAVVHNSKDILDACAGVIQNIYNNLEKAGQLSSQYIMSTSAKVLAERGRRPADKFQEMITQMYT